MNKFHNSENNGYYYYYLTIFFVNSTQKCLDKFEVLKLRIIFYLTIFCLTYTLWLSSPNQKEKKKMLSFVILDKANDDVKTH